MNVPDGPEQVGIFQSENEQVDGYAFYRSPEFQALCKRFGIPWGLHTVGDMVITIPLEGLVQVRHEYRATTRKPKLGSLDTTTAHNETWRTRRPPVGRGES